MIGQVLGDVAGWLWEHPWSVLGGLGVWMAVSVAVALIAGPVMAGAEHEELEVVDR